MEKCDVCDKQFYNKSRLNRHKDMVHGVTENVSCDICETYLPSEKLTAHNKRLHTKLNCEHCEKVFSSNSRIKYHILTVHEKVPWKCNFCCRPFSSEGEKVSHEETYHSETKCKDCNMTFNKNSKAFWSHIKMEHFRVKYECDTCEKSFKTKGGLTQHLFCHSEQRIHQCDVCEANFKLKGRLTLHKRAVHEQIRVQCELCNKSIQKININTHLKMVHSERVPCDICGKLLKKINMKEHKSIVHNNVKKASCEMCGKNFSKHSKLTRHRDVVHLKLRVKCEICGKEYCKTKTLKDHILREHQTESKQCKICWTRFPSAEAIKYHLENTHKPLKCEFCEEVFMKGSEEFRNHVNIFHFQVKTECDVCHKNYKTPKEMKLHKSRSRPRCATNKSSNKNP